MAIKYIIDNPYGNKFTSTDVETGVTKVISERTAKAYAKINSPRGLFLSARASVNLRSVPQQEIFPGTMSALVTLSTR